MNDSASATRMPARISGRALGTTTRHVLSNFWRGGGEKTNLWVVQYPEQKRDDRPVLQGGQQRISHAQFNVAPQREIVGQQLRRRAAAQFWILD